MSEILVRFDGVQEMILNKLIQSGLYKTKSEAIRAGIIELAKEYRMLEDEKILTELAVKKIKRINKGISEGKIKTYTIEEAMKKLNLKKSDLE